MLMKSTASSFSVQAQNTLKRSNEEPIEEQKTIEALSSKISVRCLLLWNDFVVRHIDRSALLHTTGNV